MQAKEPLKIEYRQINAILKGDALDVLRGMPDASMHMCVTSPPYWGLRDYGEPGQLGLEPTPEAHIAALLPIMREVRRVLRPDGTLWLNYGDCYASDFKGRGGASKKQLSNAGSFHNGSQRLKHGLKPKDLVMMPARVALALQEDGWWLRSDIIWSKPNPMPESVTDRPTNSHEHLFLLTKSARYFYDADAVREGVASSQIGRVRDDQVGGVHKEGIRHSQGGRYKTDKQRGNRRVFRGGGAYTGGQSFDAAAPIPNVVPGNDGDSSGGRNLRNVWEIATQPYSGAHFATFPEKLVEPCIKAGTSEAGCCPNCRAPWERVVEASGGTIGASWHDHSDDNGKGQRASQVTGDGSYRRTTLGFHPTCGCDPHDPVPCIVLDPFAGSGTTGVVARRLGRDFIGIDLAGGDKDLGDHTANERIAAAACGQDNSEMATGFADRSAHAAVGQQHLFEVE